MDEQQEARSEEGCLTAPLCVKSPSQNGHSTHLILKGSGRDVTTNDSVLVHSKQQSVLQDDKWAWLALVAASIVQFIVMGIHNSFGVVYNEIKTEFHWRESTSAFIGSAAVGLNFLISPVGTQLCVSHSPRVVTTVGGIISVIGLLGASFASTEYAMFLSYSIVWGVGSGLCYCSTYVIVGKLFHQHMAVAMGIVTAGSGLGQLSMGPSIESMLESFGLKTTMQSLAGIACCLILAAFTYREPPMDEREERAGVEQTWKQLFDCSLWCIPQFLILTISLAMFNFGYYIPIIHVPSFAKEMGFSEKQASWLISFMAIPSVVSRLAFGRLANHPRVNRLLMFQICMSMMALSSILCPFVATEYYGFAVYMIVFGTGEGCIIGTAPTITADIVGRNRLSPAIGLLFFSFAGPLMAGPLFAGWLYNKNKRYEEAFFVAGGTMILCLLLLSLIRWLPKKTSAECVMSSIPSTNVELVSQNNLSRVASGRSAARSISRNSSYNSEDLPLCVVHVTSV